MVEQSLFLCLLFSALGGVFAIAGRAVVVFGEKTKAKAGNNANPGKQKVLVALGFIVMVSISDICCVTAPWFGPVSVSWPTFCASLLLFNMLLIGAIMKHEKFDKNTQIATCVIVAGAVCISINGPGIQEDQNVNDLIFGNPTAILWLALLSALYITCSFLMLFTNLKKRSQAFSETILFIVNTFSSVLAGTSSKFSSMFDGSEGPQRAILFTITWIIVLIWSVENFMEPFHVRSLARFIPQVTFGGIVLNGITGVIVWEDYKAVGSWPGYVTAYFLIAMGIWLISDLDFFQYHNDAKKDLVQELSLGRFFHANEEELSQAKLERRLSSHQLAILNHSRKQGLTRCNSDPELGSCSTHLTSKWAFDSSFLDSLEDIAGCKNDNSKNIVVPKVQENYPKPTKGCPPAAAA